MSVTPTGLVFPAVEGSNFIGTVATFTTNDKGPLSAHHYAAKINWGDGHATLAKVMTNPLVAGGFVVMGRHIYTDEGSRQVNVTIHDSLDKTDAGATSWADVKDAPLVASSKTINASAGTPFTRLVAVFHNFSRFDPLDDFAISISWGDGSTSAGMLATAGAGNFKIMGSHTYGARGSFQINVDIVDLSGSSTSVVSTANVK